MFSKKTSFSVLALLAAAIFSFSSCSNAAGSSGSNNESNGKVTDVKQVYGKWVTTFEGLKATASGEGWSYESSNPTTLTFELPVKENQVSMTNSTDYSDLVGKMVQYENKTATDAWKEIQDRLNEPDKTFTSDYKGTKIEYRSMEEFATQLSILTLSDNGTKLISRAGTEEEMIFTKQ